MVSAGGGASSRAYVALTSRGRSPRALALNAGYRAAVAALNVAGLGPLQAGLSPAALRRGYLPGIREVVERLGLGGAGHVIWGHSHRSGPWPADDPAEWTAPGGARIVNTGSWVYQPHFLSPEPNGSPYWPGTAVLVEDDRPAAARAPARRPRPRRPQAAAPGVKQVAWTVTPGPGLERRARRRCGGRARRAGRSPAR